MTSLKPLVATQRSKVDREVIITRAKGKDGKPEDIHYRIGLWSAWSAMEKKQEFAELGLEQIAMYASMEDFDSEGVKPEDFPMPKAIRLFLDKLKEHNYSARIRDLLQHCERMDDGQWVAVIGDSMDAVYAGNTFELDLLALEVIKANLGDFIEGVRSNVEGRRKKSSVSLKAELALMYATQGNQEMMDAFMVEMARELGQTLQTKTEPVTEIKKANDEHPSPSLQPSPQT